MHGLEGGGGTRRRRKEVGQNDETEKRKLRKCMKKISAEKTKRIKYEYTEICDEFDGKSGDASNLKS